MLVMRSASFPTGGGEIFVAFVVGVIVDDCGSFLTMTGRGSVEGAPCDIGGREGFG